MRSSACRAVVPASTTASTTFGVAVLQAHYCWSPAGPAGLAAAVALALAVPLVILGAAPAHAGHQTVAAGGSYKAGTIVVHTRERRLYYYIGGGMALRYPVGVGRAGKQWSGTAYINGKYLNPAWTPPAEIRRDKPNLPDVVPGGSPHNPMGVAAMTLSGGEYAIHGTNRPSSIGGFVSYGCIRMLNEDITDLYGRVGYNTQVVVTD
jgi:lipoprotein-anchoring transpeptidase ErfK/SrfK